MLCEHANECPMVCPCDDECYCKSHTCYNKRPLPGMTPAKQSLPMARVIRTTTIAVQADDNSRVVSAEINLDTFTVTHGMNLDSPTVILINAVLNFVRSQIESPRE